MMWCGGVVGGGDDVVWLVVVMMWCGGVVGGGGVVWWW